MNKKRDIKASQGVDELPLRYKFLVFDWKIRDVLYNNGTTIEPVQFKEISVSQDSFYSIKKIFGRIIQIPLALLSFPEKDTDD